MTTIGGPFDGKFKWLRGILAGDGCIYGVPACASSVLKIDPSTDECTTIGGPFEGKWLWHGGHCIAISIVLFKQPAHHTSQAWLLFVGSPCALLREVFPAYGGIPAYVS